MALMLQICLKERTSHRNALPAQLMVQLTRRQPPQQTPRQRSRSRWQTLRLRIWTRILPTNTIAGSSFLRILSRSKSFEFPKEHLAIFPQPEGNHNQTPPHLSQTQLQPRPKLLSICSDTHQHMPHNKHN